MLNVYTFADTIHIIVCFNGLFPLHCITLRCIAYCQYNCTLLVIQLNEKQTSERYKYGEIYNTIAKRKKKMDLIHHKNISTHIQFDRSRWKGLSVSSFFSFSERIELKHEMKRRIKFLFGNEQKITEKTEKDKKCLIEAEQMLNT